MPPLDLAIANSPLAGLHDYQQLILGPLLEQSRVLAHIRTTQTTGSVVHIPTASAAGTGFYAEHAEIGQSDDLINEITVTPVKCASLAVLSNELAADTSPGAVGVIGDILVKSVAAAIDSSFFNGSGVAPAPLGLENVVGVSAVTSRLTVDGVADAIEAVEVAGGTASIIWCSPATWAGLTQELTNHAAVSPVGPLQRSLLGVPVVVTSSVADTDIWVADGSQTIAVLRTDGEVAVSRDAGFVKDQTHVRVTSRIGFAHPFPTTIAKLTAA